MTAMWLHFSVEIFLVVTTSTICTGQTSVESRTKFYFYGEDNQAKFVSTSREDSLTADATGCDPSDRYAIIVHGWSESCNTSWAEELRKNLITHRGGCIICMDYSAYSGDYGYLLGHFKEIAKILTAKLIALRDNFFSARTAYLFGFSFGARLIAQSGNDFGPQQIGTIHLCEPAGPGFDNNNKNADPKSAAWNAQCIHTAAGGFGTRERNCHQNWLMGNCGESQVAARPFPNGNHGLCPKFYNSAFNYYYPAVKKTKTCGQASDARDATDWPRDGTIRMGYYQAISADASNLIEKNFYCNTTRDPPYTPFIEPIN